MKIETPTLTRDNAARILQDALAPIRDGDGTIDFAEVRHCDTSAIACVLAWTRCAHQYGRTLRFINIPASLMGLARLYRVQALLGDAA